MEFPQRANEPKHVEQVDEVSMPDEGERFSSKFDRTLSRSFVSIDADLFFDTKQGPYSNIKLLKVFIGLALPCILTNILAYFGGLVNVIYASRMDDPINMAVVGLATTSIQIAVVYPLSGVNAAQDVLTSLANGDGNHALCG